MAFGPQPGPTTYIEHLHPVPDHTPQRTEDLWARRLSQDGSTIIVDQSGSTVWDTVSLLNHPGCEDARDRRRATALAHHALSLRSTERDLSHPQALAYAMPLARLAALQQLQHHHRNQLRHEPESRIKYALARTTEVIDRAYNLARMRLAGVEPGGGLAVPDIPALLRAGHGPANPRGNGGRRNQRPPLTKGRARPRSYARATRAGQQPGPKRGPYSKLKPVNRG